MIKSIYFPDKEFTTKEELFSSLRESKDLIIANKKAEIQKSCEKGISVQSRVLELAKGVNDELKGIVIDDNHYYIAVNTTKILDSHNDLHVDGIWSKSIKEQQGKNYLVVDHELCIDSVVVRKEYVEMFVATLPFSTFGKTYKGNTQTLIYKVPKNRVIHVKAKEWLDSGDQIEASVRMQYVTIEFAMDSNAPQDVTEKKRYDEFIGSIANKDEFEYIPYFFVVKEAKNKQESSLVVFGSNSVTGNINNKGIEPSDDTQKQEEFEPPLSIQKSKSFYSNFLN